jgi:CubicO group peptidase (beta-lactamase class C family)
MARLGLLMLRKGVWNGKPILKPGWTEFITTLVTPPSEIHPLELSLPSHFNGRWGYGVLWWVWDAPVNTGQVTGPYQGAYAAMGAGGQYIVVFPASDAVVVHKVDIDSDEGRKVNPDEFSAILQMVVTSDCDHCK